MVRRLSTTKTSFADDGARNALALHDILNDDSVMNTAITSEARNDITELYNEIKSEIRPPSIGAIMCYFEFMRELETNPAEGGSTRESMRFNYTYRTGKRQGDSRWRS